MPITKHDIEQTFQDVIRTEAEFSVKKAQLEKLRGEMAIAWVATMSEHDQAKLACEEALIQVNRHQAYLNVKHAERLGL